VVAPTDSPDEGAGGGSEPGHRRIKRNKERLIEECARKKQKIARRALEGQRAREDKEENKIAHLQNNERIKRNVITFIFALILIKHTSPSAFLPFNLDSYLISLFTASPALFPFFFCHSSTLY
jgi:pyruvate-formate lyase